MKKDIRLFVLVTCIMLLPALLYVGCGQKEQIKAPNTITQTSPEERVADNTLSETKDMPSSQTCMTQEERDAFRDLRGAVSLLRSADHEKTGKLDSCNANLVMTQSNLAICSSSFSELQKKHRFDSIVGWIRDTGDLMKGIAIGFVLAFVVLALIKMGIIAGKVGSL